MALQLTPSKEQLEQLDKLAKIYGKDTKEEAIYCMLQWYLGLRDKNEQLKQINLSLKFKQKEIKELEKLLLQDTPKLSR